MTMPKAQEMLSLYLYGQTTPPTPQQLAQVNGYLNSQAGYGL
jgi:hypothetical protein